MVVFKTKKIISARSIGEDLELARVAMHLSLKAVEQKCAVGEKYLQAMENNEWDILPGEIYAKNWLKKYTIFLGLSWEDERKKFENEVSGRVAWVMNNKQLFGVAKKSLVVVPRIIKNILGVLVSVLLVAYLGYQVIRLASPPTLTIIYPNDGLIIKTREIKVSGQAEKNSEVTLNGKAVLIDINGRFEVDIDLNRGLNVIILMAKKSYGRDSIEYRRIIVED
jgi:hypothetical protein